MSPRIAAVLLTGVLLAGCGSGSISTMGTSTTTASTSTSVPTTSTTTTVAASTSSSSTTIPVLPAAEVTSTTATTERVTTTSTTVTRSTTTTVAPAFPVGVKDSAGTVSTIPARPARIVSLSPSATETLFAIGAGAQVVAVDKFSNYPAGTPRTAMDGFRPDPEIVAGFRPDLVVMARGSESIINALRGLDIPVLVEAAAVDVPDALDQMRDLGAATGHVAEAAALVAGIKADLADIAVTTSARTYYWELTSTYYSASSETFIGKLLATLGLKSIAPSSGAAYPQLSPEFILVKDPDVILLADTKCCGQTPALVAARPGWNRLTAVQQGRVAPLDDDITSRWGPRIVDLLRNVVRVLPR